MTAVDWWQFWGPAVPALVVGAVLAVVAGGSFVAAARAATTPSSADCSSGTPEDRCLHDDDLLVFKAVDQAWACLACGARLSVQDVWRAHRADGDR